MEENPTYQNIYETCKQHMHAYVLVETTDGMKTDGIITGLDEENLYLAVPTDQNQEANQQLPSQFANNPTSNPSPYYGPGRGFGPGYGPGIGYGPGAGFGYGPQRRFRRL